MRRTASTISRAISSAVVKTVFKSSVQSCRSLNHDLIGKLQSPSGNMVGHLKRKYHNRALPGEWLPYLTLHLSRAQVFTLAANKLAISWRTAHTGAELFSCYCGDTRILTYRSQIHENRYLMME